jgi:hypothetical protein
MGYISVTTGVKVRAALLMAVTRKAISLAEVSGDTASDIVGFVAGDIRKVYDGMQVRDTFQRNATCPRFPPTFKTINIEAQMVPVLLSLTLKPI